MTISKTGMAGISLLAMVAMAQADSVTHSITHRSTTVDMPFVPIGHAGNADSAAGYGAVGYSYEIAQYEVSADQWAAVIADDSRVGNAGDWVGNQPTAKASWYEAARFCNWLTTGDAYNGVYQFNGSGDITGYDRSFRNGGGIAYVLPTEDEWYKAAYFRPDGSGYTLYATGNTLPGAGAETNYDDANAEPWNVGMGAEEQNLTFDMMGNVWEWTEGADGGDFFDTVNFWGGSYRSNEASLESGAPFGDDPALEHGTVGFRVAAIPEPGTISLMSISTLGLFATRRMRRRKLLGLSLMPVQPDHWCDSFCSLDEWKAARITELEGPDNVAVAKQYIKSCAINLWGTLRTPYRELEKRFWNRMVVLHERRSARRKAFRQAARRKIVDAFDAFLALLIR